MLVHHSQKLAGFSHRYVTQLGWQRSLAVFQDVVEATLEVSETAAHIALASFSEDVAFHADFNASYDKAVLRNYAEWGPEWKFGGDNVGWEFRSMDPGMITAAVNEAYGNPARGARAGVERVIFVVSNGVLGKTVPERVYKANGCPQKVGDPDPWTCTANTWIRGHADIQMPCKTPSKCTTIGGPLNAQLGYTRAECEALCAERQPVCASYVWRASDGHCELWSKSSGATTAGADGYTHCIQPTRDWGSGPTCGLHYHKRFSEQTPKPECDQCLDDQLKAGLQAAGVRSAVHVFAVGASDSNTRSVIDTLSQQDSTRVQARPTYNTIDARLLVDLATRHTKTKCPPHTAVPTTTAPPRTTPAPAPAPATRKVVCVDVSATMCRSASGNSRDEYSCPYGYSCEGYVKGVSWGRCRSSACPDAVTTTLTSTTTTTTTNASVCVPTPIANKICTPRWPVPLDGTGQLFVCPTGYECRGFSVWKSWGACFDVHACQTSTTSATTTTTTSTTTITYEGNDPSFFTTPPPAPPPPKTCSCAEKYLVSPDFLADWCACRRSYVYPVNDGAAASSATQQCAAASYIAEDACRAPHFKPPPPATALPSPRSLGQTTAADIFTAASFDCPAGQKHPQSEAECRQAHALLKKAGNNVMDGVWESGRSYFAGRTTIRYAGEELYEGCYWSTSRFSSSGKYYNFHWVSAHRDAPFNRAKYASLASGYRKVCIGVRVPVKKGVIFLGGYLFF